MEELKIKIVNLLVENAKYTAKDISAMLDADIEKVDSLIKELEDEGVIVKYSAIIDTEAIPQKAVEALIEVKVAPQKLKGFDSYAEELYNFDEVVSLYLMSGGFDLAVFVAGKDLADIANFVAQKLSVIDGIVGVQTHFILKKYKIEGQVTKKGTSPKRQIIQAWKVL